MAWEEREVKSRKTKIPIKPRVRSRCTASSTDPETWGSHDQAKDCDTQRKPGVKGGIGFVLGGLEASDGSPFLSDKIEGGIAIGGLDLDNCLDPTTLRITDEWSKKVVDRFASYTEISPSGRGLKIFFFYRRKDATAIRKVLGKGASGNDLPSRTWSRGRHEEIAVHLSHRYFAFTNNSFDDDPFPLELIPFRDFEWLVKIAGPAYQGRDGANQEVRPPGNGADNSRSGRAFREAQRIRREGGDLATFKAALEADEELAAWARDDRQVQRAWERCGDDLIRTKSGQPVSNLANALTLLRNHPDLRDLVAYDEMTSTAILRRAVPVFGVEGGGEASVARPLSDTHVIAVQEYLQRGGLQNLSRDIAHSAIDLIAGENRFHPVRDWLSTLQWDGVCRLDTWLSRYLGAEQTDYARVIGRLFLVQMVARVMRPGCKGDYVMVLEGQQGIGKSTACSILAGEYFSDSLPAISSGKEAMAHLKARWLIEIGELASLRKAEVEDIKHFISKQEDTYRPAYGRLDQVVPRQCVFVGTTNSNAYLRDETGGRRFWPVKCSHIDTEALRLDRDQLFAEALNAYKSGENWWPSSSFEREHIVPEQEVRFEVDPWEEPVRRYLDGSDDGDRKDRVKSYEVASQACGVETRALNVTVSRRIGAILTRLGWSQKRSNGTRYYVRELPAAKRRRGRK